MIIKQTELKLNDYCHNITDSLKITHVVLVPGQFGEGQFGADNLGPKYILYILGLYKILLSLSNILFINPASISAIFFHQFLTLTHIVWIKIDLLIEYITLYTVILCN